MGCGSVLGDLFYLTDALLNNTGTSQYASRASSSLAAPESVLPAGDLRAQVYNLYGEGQISEEVFNALRALADRGQLRPADLAVHRARARRSPAGHQDAEVANALRGVRSRLAQLERARADSASVLADLEARMSELDQRLAAKERAARQAIEHREEDTARRLLVEKTDLTGSYERLSAQAVALRADLARLDDLRAQLEAKAAELEAVQARSKLAALDT